MSKDEVRLSQLVGLFGSGAMVHLPDRSVVIGGLERWEVREGGWKLIDEPRLSLKLHALLQQRSELKPERTLSLRTPPLPPKTHGVPPGVAATIFPPWFVSEAVELGRLVQAQMKNLARAKSPHDVAQLRSLVEEVEAAFEGHSDDAVMAVLNQIREGAAADGQAPIKVAEFVRLAQGDAQIGRNEPGSREHLGEGLFLYFDEREIAAWMTRPEVMERAAALRAAHDRWWGRRRTAGAGRGLRDAPHAVPRASDSDRVGVWRPCKSLKERGYAIAGAKGAPPDRCGVLIYTASPGAQGSLGGLAGIARRILVILSTALKSQLMCSYDPICSDHLPGEDVGDRTLLGCACHACQLISETSCEAVMAPEVAGQGRQAVRG